MIWGLYPREFVGQWGSRVVGWSPRFAGPISCGTLWYLTRHKCGPEWRRLKFSLGRGEGAERRGSVGRKSLSRSQGQIAAEGGMGTLKAQAVLQTSCTDFDCRNDENLKISHNSPPDSWPVCFMVGVNDIFLWGLTPQPIPAAAAGCTWNCISYFSQIFVL